MGKKIAKVIAAFVFLAGTNVIAHGQDKGINLGRLAVSAFICSTFAEYAEKKDEQRRLFKIGYEAGKKLLEGVMNKTLPEEQISKAPLFFTLRLGGPTVDFMLGRIFEGMSEEALDKVVKHDAEGKYIPDPAKWNHGQELQALIASNKYEKSNCTLIRMP